jgi:RNA polymerase sigma-70 factor (ECF subfamily)
MSVIEFHQMFQGNTDFLKPFAIKLTRDPEAAKDLYQETLYRALANYTKYNEGTNIKAWLFTIMRNIFINDYRRKTRQQTVFDNSPGDFLLNNRQTTVINEAEGVLKQKEINKAIHNLPAIFRTPFLLYLDGHRYHEIAAALNEPLGTIKSRIHFARKLLKEQISQY